MYEEDNDLFDIVSKLDHADTRDCVTAERSLLSGLGGGCHLPVGAIAGVSGDHLSLCGVLGSLDGVDLIRLSAEGCRKDPLKIGADLAALIRKTGGDGILEKLDEGLTQ